MRYHLEVAKQIQSALPENLKPEMDWVINDLSCKAPEEYLGWYRLMQTVYKIVGLCVDDKYQPVNTEILLTDEWKINVMSILSTIPEEDIKKELQSIKEKKK
jgi:hypothetical protein